MLRINLHRILPPGCNPCQTPEHHRQYQSMHRLFSVSDL
jgi:hypothetical protein